MSVKMYLRLTSIMHLLNHAFNRSCTKSPVIICVLRPLVAIEEQQLCVSQETFTHNELNYTVDPDVTFNPRHSLQQISVSPLRWSVMHSFVLTPVTFDLWWSAHSHALNDASAFMSFNSVYFSWSSSKLWSCSCFISIQYSCLLCSSELNWLNSKQSESFH